MQEVSETCYETIRDSWSKIEIIGSKPNGLSILSKEFKTCRYLNDFPYPNLVKLRKSVLFISFVLFSFLVFSPLNSSSQLEDYLWSMYAGAAQYNHPPRYPVTRICGGIDGASPGSGIISKVAAGVFAYKGNLSCYNIGPRSETETDVGWRWQVNLSSKYRYMSNKPGNPIQFMEVVISEIT